MKQGVVGWTYLVQDERSWLSCRSTEQGLEQTGDHGDW